MLQSFNDLSLKVAEKATFSIDIFCEAMDEEIVPYLEVLIPMLNSIPYMQKASLMMKKAAISGIASCISSA